MSADRTYTFGPYQLRPATPEDEELARAATAADPEHAGIISPTFWLEQDRGVDCYVLTDAEGPVFFFRMQRVARLFIQFMPGVTPARNRKVLTEGMGWLDVALRAASVTELIFDSTSRLLRLFVSGKLQFRPKHNTLSRPVCDTIFRPIPPLPVEITQSIADAEPTPLLAK